MTNTDIRTALFIKLSRLGRRWSPIELIHITHSSNGLDYGWEALIDILVHRYFSACPVVAKILLTSWSDPSIQQTKQQLTRTHARQKRKGWKHKTYLNCADYVFLVDPWWNTAVQQQAVDRAYRIGQTKMFLLNR